MYLDEVLDTVRGFNMSGTEKNAAYFLFTGCLQSSGCAEIIKKMIYLRALSLEKFREYKAGNSVEDMYFVLTVLSSVPFLRNPTQSRVDAVRETIEKMKKVAMDCEVQSTRDPALCSAAISTYNTISGIVEKALKDGWSALATLTIPEAFMLGSLIRATIISRELGFNPLDTTHLFLAFSCTYRSSDAFVNKRVRIHNNAYTLYFLR